METKSMSDRAWVIFLGLLTAVVVGIMIFPDEATETLNSLGDVLYNLTTSEQSRFDNLQPDVQTQLTSLILALDQQGIKVRVGQTLRTPSEEKAAIDSGHSAVKTHSWHELGRAVDLYPQNPATGADAIGDASDIELYRTMHDVAASLGWRGIAFNDDGSKRLITNSKGRKIWDGGHLEWRAPYGTIAEAIATEGGQYGIA